MASSITPLDKLNVDLKAMVKDLTETQVVLVQKKITFDALSGFIKNTPVDEGRARGGWQVGINEPPPVKQTVLKDKGTVGDPSGQTLTAGLSALGALGPFQIVFITNNVPYIVVLDQGQFDPADPPEDAQARKRRRSSRSDPRREQAKAAFGDEGATFVAGGYSKQAPAGIVDVTIASLRVTE